MDVVFAFFSLRRLVPQLFAFVDDDLLRRCQEKNICYNTGWLEARVRRTGGSARVHRLPNVKWYDDVKALSSTESLQQQLGSL